MNSKERRNPAALPAHFVCRESIRYRDHVRCGLSRISCLFSTCLLPSLQSPCASCSFSSSSPSPFLLSFPHLSLINGATWETHEKHVKVTPVKISALESLRTIPFLAHRIKNTPNNKAVHPANTGTTVCQWEEPFRPRR